MHWFQLPLHRWFVPILFLPIQLFPIAHYFSYHLHRLSLYRTLTLQTSLVTPETVPFLNSAHQQSILHSPTLPSLHVLHPMDTEVQCIPYSRLALFLHYPSLPSTLVLQLDMGVGFSSKEGSIYLSAHSPSLHSPSPTVETRGHRVEEGMGYS